MNVTVQLYHDVRRQKKNGKYPVKVRVTHLGVQKYYPTGIDLSKDECLQALNPKVRKAHLSTRIKLDNILNKMRSLINSLPTFSFNQLERLMRGNAKSAADIFPFFDQVIQTKKTRGKIKTALTYQTAKSSFKSFRKRIGFYDITPDFLIEYEAYMRDMGYSLTTVGINLRNLRAIYNEAINQGLITDLSAYPFKKSRYSIPKGRNVKKALTRDQVKKIASVKVFTSDTERWARDMWMFIYLANGLNPSDVFRLRKNQITEGYITVTRNKTKDTATGALPIVIYLRQELKDIIQSWCSSTGPFLFPGVDESMTEERCVKVIDQKVKLINTHMARITRRLEIEIPVTTYSARHSFATILKEQGESIEIISEALGHSSQKTTRAYLNSFSQEKMKAASDKLL
jgi:integrase/recombinase XerD